MKLQHSLINEVFPLKKAYAHCDIPCGIYDPHGAQVAAHTVVRMTSLINELKASSENAPFEERKEIIHKLSRLTSVKEEHAEIVKKEVRVIWGDYFKPELIEKFPQVSDLTLKILRTASKAKQEISLNIAEELLKQTQEFAEIFYQSKGLTPSKVKPPFPTEGEIVSFKA